MLGAGVGCRLGGNAADAAVERLAGDIKHEVETALANLSPGEFSAGGVSYLTSAIEKRRGTVLESDSTYTIELGELQAWVDAKFTVQTGGFYSKEGSVTTCLRFEVRWTYHNYVAYAESRCP